MNSYFLFALDPDTNVITKKRRQNKFTSITFSLKETNYKVLKLDNETRTRTMEDHQALFRLFNPLSPTTRRTTRVLQEMQAQGGLNGIDLDELSISQQQPSLSTQTPAQDVVLRPANVTIAAPTNTITALRPHILDNSPLQLPERRRLSGNNFDDSFGQTGSPDEAVIQARGRRQVPLTFSPDINNTPLRQQMQRAKLAAMSQNGGSRLMLPSTHTRTSPRKRLTLNDTPPSSSCVNQVFTPSPDKLKISPLNKKVRIDPLLHNINPETAIKGLSHSQLINLVSSILQSHPEIVNEVHEMLPAPDLAPLEEKLNYLKRNIYKALPNTRLESKTDSMAYNRVSIHLTTFKKAVLDSIKNLLEGQQWLAVIDYTVLAWSYVQSTPVWENPSHNNIRKTCFKSLAASCLTALKKGNFTKEQTEEIRKKLIKLKDGSDEIIVCLKHFEES